MSTRFNGKCDDAVAWKPLQRTLLSSYSQPAPRGRWHIGFYLPLLKTLSPFLPPLLLFQSFGFGILLS